jgi:2-phosphosulfolactate phosphatase
VSVKRKIQVCLSTDYFFKYSDNKSTVVVVDLLRATTVISIALEKGVSSIIPVKTLNEAIKYKKLENHIIAAERNTLPIEGFDYGNSPFHYLNSNIIGKTLVLTTTNGTKAIHLAKYHKVITASFVNISAVTDYLIKDNNDIIILCSGWKGYFNLEDTIFAGALCQKLLDTNNFNANCDSLLASIQLYSSASKDLFKYLDKSSYRRRNSSEEVIKDTRFCLNPTITSNIIPIYINKKLVKII